MYLLQIVYGFVLTFPLIKWFHSPLGKNTSVVLQLRLFSVCKNVTLERAGEAAVDSDVGECVPWRQESRTRGLMAPILSVIRRHNHLFRGRGKVGTLVTRSQAAAYRQRRGPR